MPSFDDLKQRKVFQWTLAYLAGAWLLMQLVGWLVDAYNLPHTILRVLPVLLAVGLLITLIVAWYHGEAGRQRVSAVELVMVAGILLMAAAGVALVRGGGDKPAKAASDVASAAPAAEQGSIAVLPFTDMSAARDQDFFSEGLTEELLNALAQLPALRVAARTSSFSFRDKNVAIDSIGRALHVEYVVEGSVRTAGERVRITAQLIKAATGFHLWSEKYDRDVKDVFAVQDEISRSIVQALQLKMSGTDTTSIVRAGTQNPEAHQLVLKGIFEFAQRGAPELKNAETAYRRAIALDPNYAEAYAGLAEALQYQAYRRLIPLDKGYEQARAAANQALQLNPEEAKAYQVLGRILDAHDWKFAEAEAHFKKALDLNPGLADAYSFRAWLLMRLGKTEESLAMAKKAVERNPLSPTTYNALGSMYAYARRPLEALDAYQSALTVTKDQSVVASNLMLTYSDAKQYDKAVAVADQYRADQDPFTLASRAYVYAMAGRRAEAEKVADVLVKSPDISPYLKASAIVALGRGDEVFRYLEQALAEHDDYLPDVGVDPVFDAYRKDPRMGKLLRRIGLPSPTLHN